MPAPRDGALLDTFTIASTTFKASVRTAAHLEFTIDELHRRHPDAKLVIIQPCFNTDVKESAGTHDFDAVLDVRIDGLGWWGAQRFLRECGWAAWYRHTGDWAKKADWHIHMVSLGYATPVGEFVPGQVDDYKRHAMGLKGQHDSDLDDSWFPPNIKWTVFIYPPEDPVQTLLNDLRDLAHARKVSLVFLARVALLAATDTNAGTRLARIRTARATLRGMI